MPLEYDLTHDVGLLVSDAICKTPSLIDLHDVVALIPVPDKKLVRQNEQEFAFCV